MIIGPADTPFEDGTFKLVMQFDENYPNKPPQVKFISKMVWFLSPACGCVCEWTVTDCDSFIQMCMLRGTCVLIFCRIGGRPLTTWPLSSHRTSSFPFPFLSFYSAPRHASSRRPPSMRALRLAIFFQVRFFLSWPLSVFGVGNTAEF